MKLPIVLNYLGFSAYVLCNDYENSLVAGTKPEDMEHASIDIHQDPHNLEPTQSRSDTFLENNHEVPINPNSSLSNLKPEELGSQESASNLDRNNIEGEEIEDTNHDSRVYTEPHWDEFFDMSSEILATLEYISETANYYEQAYSNYASLISPIEEWWDDLWWDPPSNFPEVSTEYTPAPEYFEPESSYVEDYMHTAAEFFEDLFSPHSPNPSHHGDYATEPVSDPSHVSPHNTEEY